MADLETFDEFVRSHSVASFEGKSLPHFGVPRDCDNDFFVPPLLLCDNVQRSRQVTLVSARGAAGKSRAARELARRSRCPLWLLETDKAVSGTALERNLIHYLSEHDLDKAITSRPAPMVIIDSLDEARTRVSGASWDDFVRSLAELAQNGVRIVLFGRERTLDDLWVALDDLNVYIDRWEISHFAIDQCREYVDCEVARRDRSADNTSGNYILARDAVIGAISAAITPPHADVFVGYPPVLDAVAANLIRKPNLLAIRQNFEDARRNSKGRLDVLKRILGDLLIREQGKIEPMLTDLGLVGSDLYAPAEQVAWLCHSLEKAPQPRLEGIADAKLRATYATKIADFCDDHPYKSESGWASPVFEAYIAATSFDNDTFSSGRLLEIGNTSGLLFDFVEQSTRLLIDEVRFAALHASVLASEWTDTQISANLQDAGGQTMEGAFRIIESGEVVRGIDFDLIPSEDGSFRLYGPLADLTVVTDGGISIPARAHGIVVGPDFFIKAAHVAIEGYGLEFARRSDADANRNEADASVVIEATQILAIPPESTRLPLDGELEIRVPADHVMRFPWVSYVSAIDDNPPDPHERAVRFLNKFMSLTRRHGHKGEAGVFIKKFLGRQNLPPDKFNSAVNALVEHGAARLQKDILFMTDSWERYRYNGKAIPGQVQFTDVASAWSPVLRDIETHI